MLLRHPNPTAYRRAVAIHESAYRVAGTLLGLALRRPKRAVDLRRAFADVFDFPVADDKSPEVCERMALAMLTADAALQLLAPTFRGNDEIEAWNLLYLAFIRRYGMPFAPSNWREFNIQKASMQAEAQELAAEQRDEISRAATSRGARAAARRAPAPARPVTTGI